MAKLASRLGFSTMALYRHVPNKAALQVLMVDAGIGRPTPDFGQHEGWRPALETLSRSISATYRRHPWLLDIPISGPPATPNNLRWLEAGLVALRETPLDIGEKMAIWLLAVEYVRGQERLFLELSRGFEASGGMEVSYADLIRRIIRIEEFPEIARAIDEHAFEEAGVDPTGEIDADFDFGLQRVLDGIEVYIKGEST